MILIMYNFVLKFFFEISFVYQLKDFLIPFYVFSIVYRFGEVFGDKFGLMYYLYALFHNLIIINYIEDASNFFLKKIVRYLF